jgi:hypothetical protein
MWNALHAWLFDWLPIVWGQVAPVQDGPPVALTGFWLGIYAVVASLMAAGGTIAKNYWDDKDKERKEETVRLRITHGNDRSRRLHIETREYLQEFAEWAAKIPGAPPGMPSPPGPPEQFIHHEPDGN